MRNYRARGITADGKPIFDEAHEHIIVADWLTMHGVFFIHVPMGEKRPGFYKETPDGKKKWISPTGKKLKRMGARAGVVDFLIFDPPPIATGYPRGTVLEIKALDGAKPTPEQIQFLWDMDARGYAAQWWRGSDAAIKWLQSLGYGRRSEVNDHG